MLRALRVHGDRPPVLLIDEVDRADEEFEALLLEVLSDFQVSIPELGTVAAETPPVVVITSNRMVQIWVSFISVGLEDAYPVAILLVAIAVIALVVLTTLASNPWE